MSDNSSEFVDGRTNSQATLEVGESVERTKDRDSKITGSKDFEDKRDPETPDREQSQLFPDVDENQATLGGGKASDKCLFDED